MTPVVSVLIPAYNAAGFIAAAVDSARGQTLREIEILVIDDASTDATANIVQDLAMTDSRVRLLRQTRNGGPSVARNTGIAASRGEWVALLDADDQYAPDRLERLVAVARRHGADLCSDNLLLDIEGDDAASQPMIGRDLLPAERPLDLLEFITRNVADRRWPRVNYGFLKPIIRRAFLAQAGLRYDERVRFAEDFALYSAALLAGARWWITPAATYRYRVRPGSLTQVQTVADLQILRGRLDELLNRSAGQPELTQAVRRQRAVVSRCLNYRWFTDEVKARRYGSALRSLVASRESFTSTVEQAVRELPTITGKALRGGYSRSTSVTSTAST